MPITKYYVVDLLVTGTDLVPQEVKFADHSDYLTGDTLETSFEEVPIISIPDNFAVHIVGDVENHRFYIALDEVHPAGDMYINFWVIETTEATGENFTIQNMINLLAVYLNDITKKLFKPSLKVSMLNMANTKMIHKLKPHLLTEIIEKETGLTINSSTGEFDLSTLKYNILNGFQGILRLFNNDGYPINRISEEEYSEHLNNNLTDLYSVYKSVYRVIGNNIYIYPYDDITSFDIYYLREPKRMVLGSTPAGNIDCEFDYDKQMIILGLACEEYIDISPMAKRAYEVAINKINELNEIPSSDSVKYGVFYGSIGLNTYHKYNLLTDQ